MTNDFDFILQVIRVDFFIAFGLYSILYVLISAISNFEILKVIDEYACKIIVYIGILFFLVWTSGLIFDYIEKSNIEKLALRQRLFGKYWLGYWLQPILYILISQLLRLRQIRKNLLLRFFFSIVFIISIEQFIILTVSLHRDYLPSSFNIDFTPVQLIIGTISKILIYFGISTAFYLTYKKIKSKKKKQSNKSHS